VRDASTQKINGPLKRLSSVMVLLLLCNSCAQPKGVSVKEAWVRATVPGQEVAGAYMRLTSAQAAQLIKVESPIAKNAEIHNTSMDGNVMRMQRLPALELPAGQTVTLAPGGVHIMLLGLSTRLKAEQNVALKLHILDAQRKETVVEVIAPVKDTE
jgi:periplasmic copper chaperone A